MTKLKNLKSWDYIKVEKRNPQQFLSLFAIANEESLFQSQLSTMELQQQEQIMQLTTSWEQKGIVKGRQEEKLAITLRLLNRKLGSLPDAIATQIESLEPNRLDTLTEDLLDFNSLDDLQIWLSHS
jgi:hypothetical protein